VAEEHAAYAQVVQLVQTGVDVVLVALRDVQDLLAAERLGRLDAQDDGQLALLDDLRACALSVTIRNQPLPVPPYILSM
jgi:hypothetical protein